MPHIDTERAAAIERELIALKDAALDATRRGDGAFYDRYLAEDAVAIVPRGAFGKAEVVGQMAAAAGAFRSLAVEQVRAVALADDCGLVTYRARYPHGDVLVSTVYLRRAGSWKGVLYQQTPVAAAS